MIRNSANQILTTCSSKVSLASIMASDKSEWSCDPPTPKCSPPDGHGPVMWWYCNILAILENQQSWKLSTTTFSTLVNQPNYPRNHLPYNNQYSMVSYSQTLTLLLELSTKACVHCWFFNLLLWWALNRYWHHYKNLLSHGNMAVRWYNGLLALGLFHARHSSPDPFQHTGPWIASAPKLK